LNKKARRQKEEDRRQRAEGQRAEGR